MSAGRPPGSRSSGRERRAVVAAARVPAGEDRPRRAHGRPPVDRQVEEVGGARDARVVAADQPLEAAGRLLVRQVEDRRREAGEVGLDRGLVLGRRRHDRGRADDPGLVHLVAMEQQAARRLGRPGGDAGGGPPRDGRLPRPLVGVEQVARLGGRVDELDRPREDAPEDVRLELGGLAGLRERARRQRVEPVARRARSAPTGRAGTPRPRASGRAGREVPSTCSSRNASGQSWGAQVEAVARDDAALVHRVLVGWRRLTRSRRASNCGASNPATSCTVGLGELDRLVEVVAEALELLAPRGPVQAADAEADRVDRPAADDRQDVVADPLEPQALLDDRAIDLRELDGRGQPQEVRRMQQVDVERVALDPLAAVQEPAERADRRVDDHAEGRLERVDGRELVRDRADAADPGDDVDDLVGRPADHQPLEVPRRLEDPEPGLDDLAVAHPQVEAAPRPRRGSAPRPRRRARPSRRRP